MWGIYLLTRRSIQLAVVDEDSWTSGGRRARKNGRGIIGVTNACDRMGRCRAPLVIVDFDMIDAYSISRARFLRREKESGSISRWANRVISSFMSATFAKRTRREASEMTMSKSRLTLGISTWFRTGAGAIGVASVVGAIGAIG